MRRSVLRTTLPESCLVLCWLPPYTKSRVLWLVDVFLLRWGSALRSFMLGLRFVGLLTRCRVQRHTASPWRVLASAARYDPQSSTETRRKEKLVIFATGSHCFGLAGWAQLSLHG